MMLASVAMLKARLGISHDRQDEQLQRLLEGVSAAIQTFIGCNIETAEYTERYNGNGKNRLVLKHYPVKEVRQVKIDGREVADFDFDNWLLIRHGGFSEGIRNVGVRYVAGYDEVPADIVEAVLALAMQRLNEIENKGVQSKTLAGETIAFSNFGQSDGMPPAAFSILNAYKRRV